MDSEPSKSSWRKGSAPRKYRKNALATGESSATQGEGPVVSRPGQLVNRGSSRADRDAAPVNRAQHGPNEEGPANASEYCGGPGDLGSNFEYNVRVIRLLEYNDHITSEFREKLFTWFCLRANKQGRRVLNAFIKTLKDDLGSLAEQLKHTFGGSNDLSVASSLTNL